MTNTLRWALSSDQQIPFHDPRAIDLWFKVLRWWKPDVVDYLGDTSDQACFSTYSDGKSGEFLNAIPKASSDDLFPFIEGNERPVREFYEKTRKMLPNAEIFSALGNHDIRVWTYLDKKAPDMLKNVTPETLWGLDNLGVDYIYYDDLPKHRYGDIYVHHGISALKAPGDSVKSDMNDLGVSLIRGHCFSEDTEILTIDGWKNLDNIKIGTLVYTLNKETNKGEWQPIKDKFVYNDYKELLRIKSKNIDLLVTPEHGLIWQSKTKGSDNLSLDGKWKESTAQNLSHKSNFIIPLAVESTDSELAINDAELKMLSWVMAEGNFDYYKTSKGEKRYRVRISQSDNASKGGLAELELLYKELGWKFNPILRYKGGEVSDGQYRNYDAYRIQVRRRDSNGFFEKWLKDDKMPKEILYTMSARQAKIFLEEYTLSDGNWNKDSTNSFQLCSYDKPLLDFLQALAMKAGYRSSISRENTITINLRSRGYLDKRHFNLESYSDRVWCVEVDNHTLAIRRNGKTTITMNSHRAGSFYKTMELRNEVIRGFEIGHMCDVSSDAFKYSTIRNWQQGFMIGHIESDCKSTIDGYWPHLQFIHISPDYTCCVDGKLFKA